MLAVVVLFINDAASFHHMICHDARRISSHRKAAVSGFGSDIVKFSEKEVKLVQEKAGCTDDEALTALQQYGHDMDDAVSLARSFADDRNAVPEKKFNPASSSDDNTYTTAAASKHRGAADGGGEPCIYILDCEHGRKYVGSTNNLEQRKLQHQNRTASEWTKIHPMLDLVVHEYYLRDINGTDLRLREDMLTKELMFSHGIDKVRGGSYCSIVLTDQQKEVLEKKRRHTLGLCFNCGGDDHYAKDCKLPSQSPQANRSTSNDFA